MPVKKTQKLDPQALYRKIRRVLNDDRAILRIKNLPMITAGEQLGELITLNPRHDILSTCIHEVLHFLYPMWSESVVLRYERMICRSLTERQFRGLLKLLGEKIS